MLAVSAQTSVADPVNGVLGTVGAVGATATQQLDSVARDATAIPLPTPPPAVAEVTANAAQGVTAVPQAVAGAGDVVRSNASGLASGLAESSRAGDSGDSGEGSGPRDTRQSSPPSSLIAAATRAGRVAASPAPPRGEHAAIVTAARRIVSSRVDRGASTLAYAERHTPAARALAGRATRVAGALLGAVTNVATGARDTLATTSVPVVASLLRATQPPNPFTLFPAGAGAGAGTGAAVTQPSNDPAALASLASIVSAGAEPSSVAPLGAQPVQQLAADREALADTRAQVHGTHGTTASKTTALATGTTPTSAASLANARVAATTTPSQAVPAPAPPPGGFTPASSAGVAGGASAATFLALAALLLLAAPRALRRLQRARTSWRLAQFSLIPARPG
jgi:hypothetical protein